MTLDNKRITRTQLKADNDDKDAEKGEYTHADDILNHTAASGFGKKQQDKEFNKKQTKDYERSIVMLDMSDGVSLARGGGAIQAKSKTHARGNPSSQDMVGYQRQFIMQKLQSAKREGQKQPPMSAFLQEQSILSEGYSPQKNNRTPNIDGDIVSTASNV